ncbi:hypothetical protein MCOR10_010916, partial [Pyricularia oryzae]
MFTAVQSVRFDTQKTAYLQHYSDGPFLSVKCCEFTPTYKHQIHALKKDANGWHSVRTTAYCVVDEINVAEYIRNNIDFATFEARSNGTYPVNNLFDLAWEHKKDSIVNDCLELYTALCLMSKGCQFLGVETLGMAPVLDSQSAWFGSTPLPRMVQNHISHCLEIHIAKLDAKIMRAVSSIFDKRSRNKWHIATLAVFLLLHVRELDAGRNIYWKRYKDTRGFWIHPSKPAELIEEASASCNSLLWHYHCSFGRKPLEMNWDIPSSKALVDNDEKALGAIVNLKSIWLSLMQRTVKWLLLSRRE